MISNVKMMVFLFMLNIVLVREKVMKRFGMSRLLLFLVCFSVFVSIWFSVLVLRMILNVLLMIRMKVIRLIVVEW